MVNVIPTSSSTNKMKYCIRISLLHSSLLKTCHENNNHSQNSMNETCKNEQFSLWFHVGV